MSNLTRRIPYHSKGDPGFMLTDKVYRSYEEVDNIRHELFPDVKSEDFFQRIAGGGDGMYVWHPEEEIPFMMTFPLSHQQIGPNKYDIVLGVRVRIREDLIPEEDRYDYRKYKNIEDEG